MPGRTWIIAPDKISLEERWQRLIKAPKDEKETLFHPHLNKGELGDRHTKRIISASLVGFEPQPLAIVDEKGPGLSPIRYGFRSFDRQWIIPDNRVINRPNPELWSVRSDDQIFLTVFTEESPLNGPALTFTALIPDLHHYKGSFGGRAVPLWRDAAATVPNVKPKLLNFLTAKYGVTVAAAEVVAYIATIAAHPAYTARFQDDLSTPGLRIPLTADHKLFNEAATLGRKIIWLHTFGERMADPDVSQPAGPPRLPNDRRPRIPADGTIPPEADSLNYDATKQRLLVGSGFVENVPPAVWRYEVSGKQVLVQWFSYRRRNRERPMIGDRRQPSPLGNIQPEGWLSEYTTELINVLNVLGLLVELEPEQASLLEKVCAAPTISADELEEAGALAVPAEQKGAKKDLSEPDLFAL